MVIQMFHSLGHPAPTYKNDRAWKAFEFFIPELDKEVDMASDLVKAMFDGVPKSTDGESTGEKTGEKTRMKTGEKILNLVRERPEITALEMAAEIGITVKGVQWAIHRLKEEGRLCRIGPDKGGRWEVVEEQSSQRTGDKT